VYQDVKVAVVSKDPRLSDALCALFALERVSCAVMTLDEGLTYIQHQSRGCIVLHADTSESLPGPLARWSGFEARIVLLLEAVSGKGVEGLVDIAFAEVLNVPVSSQHLLRAVYAVLGENSVSKG